MKFDFHTGRTHAPVVQCRGTPQQERRRPRLLVGEVAELRDAKGLERLAERQAVDEWEIFVRFAFCDSRDWCAVM